MLFADIKNYIAFRKIFGNENKKAKLSKHLFRNQFQEHCKHTQQASHLISTFTTKSKSIYPKALKHCVKQAKKLANDMIEKFVKLNSQRSTNDKTTSRTKTKIYFWF